ncbi:protein ApaG [Sesamum angolense]|uniref:Protein ApaG n=1 Tax=Sesamum angolense TaxID=2727404 RepID=A0AAE2BR48_9LAMI|nr:protein ApaG [Sesamum angolense]
MDISSLLMGCLRISTPCRCRVGPVAASKTAVFGLIESLLAACGFGFGSGSGSGPVQGSSQSPFFSRTETYALLKQQLEVAAKAEDYKEAARLRDSLRVFEEEEPVLRLQRLLKEAIAQERFEDAARVLEFKLGVCTLKVEVSLERPLLFAYRIRITNNSDRPVQLLRRHWIITDANGKTESVQGVGVIGEQPVILPKTGFEYSSACPLSTSSGRMFMSKVTSVEVEATCAILEGDFEMKHIDKVGTRTFNVAIAPFALSTFGDGADTT